MDKKVKFQLEHIRKRQQARFLEHLRETSQNTDRLEGDVCRMLHFVFSDVEKLLEKPEDQINAKAEL